MKVLLLSPLPPPYGGIASWTVNILKYVKRKDIGNLYHLNTSIKFRSITSISICSRLFYGLLDFIVLLFRYIKNLIVIRPDVVYITSSGSLGFIKNILMICLSKCFRCKVVVHLRFGRIPQLFMVKNWEYQLLIIVVKLSNSLILLDKRSYELLSSRKLNTNIYCIPNPVSEDVESLAKQDIQIKDNYFLFVGHVIKAKGIKELLEAFKCSENKKLRLKIVGPIEANMREQINDYLINNGLLNRVDILGPLHKDKVLLFMSKAYSLILPSYTEGFPNVVIEAMACGCPVLAADVGAVKEMVNFTSIKNASESAGICFPPKSVERLLSVINYYNNNLEIHNILALNGKKRILDYYTLAKIIPQYKKTL